MSDYTPSTNFSAKDALVSGNPSKIIKGTEISAEFTAIQTAIATKYDSASTVPVSAGGTGATTAATARTSLGITPANIGAAASGANSDITSLSAITSINGGQLAGLRNKIINGKMEIAQRGTSFAAIASGAYSLDRWAFLNSGASNTVVGTMSQTAENVNNSEFQSTLRYTVTTADASLDSAHITQITQRIEGFNARDLIGRTFTLSFWVRSAKTGAHSVQFANSNNDRTYVLAYTVNATDTWEYKTLTVSGGLITAGTWDWTSGVGLQLRWTLACGGSFQTASAGTWISGDARALTSQVNVCDTIGNIFAITGVQLEVGSVATPFEHRPYGMELALCQRYFEALVGNGYAAFGYGATSATTVWNAAVTFRVTKRAVPSVSLSANSDFCMFSPSWVTPFAVTSASLLYSTPDSVMLQGTVASGLTANTHTAIASNNTTNARIFIASEL